MIGEYDDIINLPHPVSKTRARMSPVDRAAQFSPFAALTGYDAAVQEAGRLTCDRAELDEDARLEINDVLMELSRHLQEEPEVAVTHFVPDERKAGGQYLVTKGRVRRICPQDGYLLMKDGRCIFFEDIIAAERINEEGLPEESP